MSTTTDTEDQPIADALFAAFTAAGWDVVAMFHGGYDVKIGPGLVATTGVTGWDYASVNVVRGSEWEPAEVEGLGNGPAWDEPGDDLDAFAAGAVTAMRAYAAAYVARTCADGGADEVGLDYAPGESPTPAEVAEVVTAPIDTPWLVALAATSAKCPECLGAYHHEEDWHVVHRDGTVLVGCEGFHTAILRSLVLRARAAAVTA